MLLHVLQKPSVLNLPVGLIGLVLNQESDLRQSLAESDIGGQLLEIGELLDQLVLGSWHFVSDLGFADQTQPFIKFARRPI
jgi:hypothetical protein